MIGQCTLPLLVLASFFLNFATMESPARMSDKYTTLITPPRIAFWVWVPIYAMQALYVFYQILSSKARNSKLVQNKISILFIFHQILIAAWLNLFNHDHIYPATAIIICAWALTLFIFGCITIEFRTGKYPKYTVRDFICIEIPFALLLGWETLATAISISIFIVRLYYDNFTSLNTTAALQMTAVIVTFALITLIAILFAGLPALMDPFVHLPIIWGLSTIGWRWLKQDHQPIDKIHLSWAIPALFQAVSYAAWIVASVITVFFVIAAVIIAFSRLCVVDQDSESDESSSPSIINHSSRTARSAMTVERV